MQINTLHLKNIGPFKDAEIDFIGESRKIPITIITGENGAGKTIILDAIRALLAGYLGIEMRNILRNNDNFLIDMKLFYNDKIHNVKSNKEYIGNINKRFSLDTNDTKLANKFLSEKCSKSNIWITNYWTSRTDNKQYKISNLQFLIPENYLINSLSGIQSNIEVIQLITYFDYLKSSDNVKEREEGEFLFNTLKKIIKLSLIDGEFQYVERKTLIPIISQNGVNVSLDKLSSGNLYLIQRMISLLGQMYSVYTLNNLKLEEMLLTPGLLMIDEAENHLHPKWQKTFLNSILEIFPNLQLIVTTHSPFIVSSVENARIYVCKPMTDHSILVDETSLYSNKPIDEILMSDIFNTNPFNEAISNLMKERIEAINEGNIEKSTNIETELKKINPQYFSYFDIDTMLKTLSK
jgi:predicted ATP-binding protein involved in virulence